MSSQARQDLEADTVGSQSSSRGIIPSHPVEFDSDMEEASRSVSPEPHNHKAASQGKPVGKKSARYLRQQD